MQLDADILIAGGSTAGLATAIYARLAGLSCVVVEPRIGVLDKACGEGLMPAVVPLFAEMGIGVESMHQITGIRYLQGDQVATCPFPNGQGLGVRRTVLHKKMLTRARELGAEFKQGKVKDFKDHGSYVEVDGKKYRYLIGCDGLKSQIRKELGLPRGRKRTPRYGLRQHFQVDEAPTFVEVYWRKDFELYITPVDRHTVNVAVLFEKGRPFDKFLEEVPAVAKKLGAALSPVLGAGPFEQARLAPKKGNVFLVGDAAGFLDPITGEGNQLAIGAARALISSIAVGQPEIYPVKFKNLSRDYWLLTSLLLLVARIPALRKLIVPLLRFFPGLFKFALSRLCKGTQLKTLPFLAATSRTKETILSIDRNRSGKRIASFGGL